MVEMKVRVQDVSQFKSLVLHEGKHARGVASRIDDQGLVGIVVHQVTIGFQGTKLKDFYVKHTTSQGLKNEKKRYRIHGQYRNLDNNQNAYLISDQ
jgi:hypothetical protein